MEETVIYLIRHSEQLKKYGIKNIDDNSQIENEKIVLSIDGEKKAEELSKLKDFNNIDIIYSSSYTRAIATAKYIANNNNLLINIDKNFNERKLGNLEKLKELGKTKKYTFTEEQLLDENFKNIDGESRKEVNERMSKALNKVLKEHGGEKIVIVSHGAAIKFLLMNWCKLNSNHEIIFNDLVLNINSPSVIKLEFERN